MNIHKYSNNNAFSPNYPQPFRSNFYSNMSFLPSFRLSSASRKHVATGPAAASTLTFRLDFRTHTPADSGGEATGSLRADTPDESEGEGTGTRVSTPEEEGSSRANTPDNADSAATSKKRGSFNWDREKGGFSLEWANLAEFEKWRRVEERTSSIELNASSTRGGGVLWTWSQRFVCGRQNTGGARNYQKKHPTRQRKIQNRKSGCGCHIIIKKYPHTSTILGRYVAEHDHEIGAANIAFTRLSRDAREHIKMMLTHKIDRNEIVSCRNKNSLAANLIHFKVRVIRNWAPDGTRDHLINLKEVNQIANALDNDNIRLHPDDAISTRLMMEKLAAQGAITFYKDKQDRAPDGSRLPEDAFVLCIQTRYQLDAFRRLGNGFIGIDATHNVTQYQNLLLFTIIARDNWGQGKSLIIIDFFDKAH